jgi:hypothetical protein
VHRAPRPGHVDPHRLSQLRRLRAQRNLLKRIKVIPPVQSSLQKYFHFYIPQIRSRTFASASGALRGEVVNARLAVIASAAKQSILPLRGKMDCFAALAMTVYKLNRRGC